VRRTLRWWRWQYFEWTSAEQRFAAHGRNGAIVISRAVVIAFG
jgi:hypothetical protein